MAAEFVDASSLKQGSRRRSSTLAEA